MGATTEDVFNALGVIGGVVLAFSLLPQIYLAHKRRSTKDISYVWQVSGPKILRVLRSQPVSSCVSSFRCVFVILSFSRILPHRILKIHSSSCVTRSFFFFVEIHSILQAIVCETPIARITGGVSS